MNPFLTIGHCFIFNNTFSNGKKGIVGANFNIQTGLILVPRWRTKMLPESTASPATF
jgi:hypothetical protein